MSSKNYITDKIRVLHVDDDIILGKNTKIFLENISPLIKVDFEESPQKVAKRIHEEEYDCVISDFLMPSMNGIELAKKVRKISDIPFIIYTGQGSEEVAESAFQVGVDDYIRKEIEPSHYQVLVKRVISTVEGYRAEKMFKDIADRSFDIIFTIDKKGAFTYLSPAITRITAYEPEELVGRSFREIVEESNVSSIIEAIKLTSNDSEIIEIMINRKDSGSSFLEINLAKIVKKNRTVGYQGIARDITERKLTEIKLKKSQEHFHKLYDAMIDPVERARASLRIIIPE